LDEYIFILSLLEFSADKNGDDRQAPASKEVPMFLLENLKSAEIIIDGKKSWQLVLDKGGKPLIKGDVRSLAIMKNERG
jgi:hypothetical protein